jgi:hypothetical protein
MVLVAATALTVATASCSPRMFGAALATAAIIGAVAVLAHHDAHFHDPYCGHPHRYHDGRTVYYYGGHWEYYDPGAGTWYYYNE